MYLGRYRSVCFPVPNEELFLADLFDPLVPVSLCYSTSSDVLVAAVNREYWAGMFVHAVGQVCPDTVALPLVLPPFPSAVLCTYSTRCFITDLDFGARLAPNPVPRLHHIGLSCCDYVSGGRRWHVKQLVLYEYIVRSSAIGLSWAPGSRKMPRKMHQAGHGLPVCLTRQPSGR
jgi:hypothetical protein